MLSPSGINFRRRSIGQSFSQLGAGGQQFDLGSEIYFTAAVFRSMQRMPWFNSNGGDKSSLILSIRNPYGKSAVFPA
jgi:hypothetical protein